MTKKLIAIVMTLCIVSASVLSAPVAAQAEDYGVSPFGITGGGGAEE